MAWNEPGDKNKNPWGNQKGNKSELDDLIKDFISSLKTLFGNKGSGPIDPSSKKNIGMISSLHFLN